jgi:HEAT repeat protein
MVWLLRPIVYLILATTAAEAQGNLLEVFSIYRREGPQISEADRRRIFEILRDYSTGENLAREWQTINDALRDPEPFVRDQACALLASIVYLNSEGITVPGRIPEGSPNRPVDLPNTTKELVLERFSEANPNLRDNAVRVIALMAGGVPEGIELQLLQMARTDPATKVRTVAISALASIRTPSPEITEFWVQSLKSKEDRALRATVLGTFRSYTPSDPRVISLVIDALRDTDYFVRQEAIAAVTRIGKPAGSALPLLIEIHDAPVSDETMRANADAAIRALTSPTNR